MRRRSAHLWYYSCRKRENFFFFLSLFFASPFTSKTCSHFSSRFHGCGNGLYSFFFFFRLLGRNCSLEGLFQGGKSLFGGENSRCWGFLGSKLRRRLSGGRSF